jgi:phosphotransferase system enzyme I (PtsP)
MFPFVADCDEYFEGRAMLMAQLDREAALGHVPPTSVRVGAMLETPSLAFAPEHFFRACDFISIGGNDLKQFFFAADRENERVRKRYDTLSVPFLNLIQMIVDRCAALDVPLSFCGEDAGRPAEAATLAALGLRVLSMRPASIGPVKALLRRADLAALKALIDAERAAGAVTLRPAVARFLDLA